MLKKIMKIVLALSVLLCLTACGNNQDEGTSQSTGEEKNESDLSFSVPTINDPPAIAKGINMVNLVSEECVEVTYDEGVYIYKFSSQPTGETLVKFINELLIPGIEACSDTGECLVRDNTGNDGLGLGIGVTQYRKFDSFGYRTSDGKEYAYWIIDGEQFSDERYLYEGSRLLDVRYEYNGKLYNAITAVKEEKQSISVTPIEEPNQKFEIIE